MTPQYLPLHKAAKWCGVTRYTIKDWAKRGVKLSRITHNMTLVDMASLQKFIESKVVRR